jgi:hypothetical protein
MVRDRGESEAKRDRDKKDQRLKRIRGKGIETTMIRG